jgi:hypothetical protein
MVTFFRDAKARRTWFNKHETRGKRLLALIEASEKGER